MPEPGIPLLRTKLHRPAPVVDAVARPRLIEQLDRGLSGSVTLITAPAGFGKSTLVSQWLESRNQIPSAWLSLDRGENDLRTFVVYLLAAIREAKPGALPGCAALADQEAPLQPGIVATQLINELADIGDRVLLVLDDFHHVDSAEVQALVNALAERPLENFHLLLVSRHDPALAFSALRASGQINEIRMDALRFTGEELDAFLENSLGTSPAAELSGLVEEQTEGWPVALRLMTLSLRDTEDRQSFIADFREIPGNVWNYLVEEVFALQSREHQVTLLEISVSNRFCSGLCESVCRLPRGAGGEFVNWLTVANLFVIPLDKTGTWFRFHHLFGAFLRKEGQKRLGPGEFEKLHRAAAQWFEESGLIEEALEHRIEGNDSRGAARLVAENRHRVMNDEQWHCLDRWLNLLPSESIARDPRLIMAQAWSWEYHMRWPEAWAALDQIGNLLAKLPVDSVEVEDGAVEGEMHALRSYQQYLSSEGEKAVESCRRALDLIPRKAASVHGYALILLSAALQMVGDLAGACGLIYTAMNDSSNRNDTLEGRLLMSLSLVYWMEGDLSRLAQIASRYRTLHKEVRLNEAEGFSRYFLGISCFHRNELDEAERQLRSLLEIRYSTRPLVFVHGCFALALIRQTRGFPEEATEITGQVIDYLLATKISALIDVARAFETDLALRQGRTSEAIRWAEDYDPGPLIPVYFFFAPRLTHVRTLLARGRPADLSKADRLLAEMEGYFAGIHNHNVLIQVLLLQGRAKIQAGDEPGAEDVLRRFLALAQARGFLRFQEELSPEVSRAISRLELDEDGLRYFGEILAASANGSQAPADGLPANPVLSKREMEILTLMATTLTNEKIGEKLFISHPTVKRHTANIYRKLGVHSREGAVAKADGLGILG